MVKVKIFPPELEKLAAYNGMNRGQLAEAAGLNRATITNIIGGKKCNMNTAVSIAKALGVEVEQILQEDPKGGYIWNN